MEKLNHNAGCEPCSEDFFEAQVEALVRDWLSYSPNARLRIHKLLARIDVERAVEINAARDLAKK